MSLTSTLIGMFGGAAAALVARKAVDIWNNRKGDLQNWAMDLDNRLEHKWGVTLPENVHAAYDNIISKTVMFVDQYAASRDFWKLVIQNVLTMTPAKFDTYLAQIQNIDFGAKLKDQLSAELMTIVNDTKKDLAISISKNKAVAANLPTIENLPERVSAAATANKIHESTEPVTKEVLIRLIEESKKRQEALQQKLPK